MPYDKWKARLAGQKVVAFLTPTTDDEGYYRKPLGEKLPNGRFKVTGYVPVAFFAENGLLQGLIGANGNMREMTREEIEDESLWSYLVGNPISYHIYKAVAEHGAPWPDFEKPETNGKVLSENVGSTGQEETKEPATPEEFKALIQAIVDGAKDAKVESNDDCAIIAGTNNRLAELRLAADKTGKAQYEPPFREYKRLYGLWKPVVELAETTEKRLTRLILTFRENERKRLEAEAQKAAAQQAEKEAAEARAADRAIANGEPPALAEAPPAEEEALPPPPPQPAPIAPTYGKRKPKEEMKVFVEIDDYDKVYEFFKHTDEIKATLRALALIATKAGREVPGARKREGLI